MTELLWIIPQTLANWVPSQVLVIVDILSSPAVNICMQVGGGGMHVNNISWLYYRIICKGQWLYKVIYGQEMDVKDLSFILFLISLYWLCHVA